jgi:hypothetical protein
LDYIQSEDITGLNESIERLLEIENFNKFLYSIYSVDNSYNLIKKEFDDDIFDWIYSLSFRYGYRIFNITIKKENSLNWRGVNSKTVFDEGIIIQLNFLRNDGVEFLLECNRLSFIYLLGVLANHLDGLSFESFSERELEHLGAVIETLRDTFIKVQDDD